MKEIKAWGISSLVCGVLGLLSLLMPYLGLPLSILAVIFGVMQKKRRPTGLATAGLVLGIIGIVTNSLMLLFVLFGLMLVGLLA